MKPRTVTLLLLSLLLIALGLGLASLAPSVEGQQVETHPLMQYLYERGARTTGAQDGLSGGKVAGKFNPALPWPQRYGLSCATPDGLRGCELLAGASPHQAGSLWAAQSEWERLGLGGTPPEETTGAERTLLQADLSYVICPGGEPCYQHLVRRAVARRGGKVIIDAPGAAHPGRLFEAEMLDCQDCRWSLMARVPPPAWWWRQQGKGEKISVRLPGNLLTEGSLLITVYPAAQTRRSAQETVPISAAPPEPEPPPPTPEPEPPAEPTLDPPPVDRTVCELWRELGEALSCEDR